MPKRKHYFFWQLTVFDDHALHYPPYLSAGLIIPVGQLENVFVQIANEFVQTDKSICTNCKIYLSEQRNIFALIANIFV